MAVATVLEKKIGTEFAYGHIYGAWWFTYVWALLAGLSILGILKGRIYRNPPLFLLHFSFIVILAGAACTKILAEHGQITVTKKLYSEIVQSDEGNFFLPFGVKLDSFYVSYYPGSNAPADYTSQISILAKSGETVKGQVSMNKIYSRDGYRFYQSSFEKDWNTSVLRVNHDAMGVPLSYAGYLLFMLSMLWFLLSPKNIFRRLLKHPLLKKAAGLVLLLVISVSGYSQTITKDGLSAEKTQSEAFGNLWILNGGRIMPMFAFANDFTQKVTGKNSFGYLDAVQFFMGMLFFPDKWKNIPVFKIEDRRLRAELNIKGDRARLVDFYDYRGIYKLGKYWSETSGKTPKSAFIKEVEKLNDKIQLIEMLHNGSLLQMYPIKTGGFAQWLNPTQNLTNPEEEVHREFIRSSLFNYFNAMVAGDESGALAALNEIGNFQSVNAGEALPSDTKRWAERFNIKANLTSWLFKFGLTAGLLSLLSLLFLSEKRQLKVNKIFYFLLILSFVTHSVSIGLRTCIAGRLPFSNGYETMLLIAWCAVVISMLFGRKIPLLTPFGFLLSGCTLLVAHISMMNPQITPLVPVLSSPLLSIHVSVIMLSYTLTGFVALNSITSFIQIYLCKKGREKATLQIVERNRIYSLICLYPAVFLLGSGIFTGAIWANISWGRYWGWDPKEVWALITFMLYSLVFHQKTKLFSNVFAFHTFGLLAFASVLMTYFGVNYILGGMHSYAGEIQSGGVTAAIVAAVVIIAAFLTGGYLKYLKLK